jgi:hypothetical protein
MKKIIAVLVGLVMTAVLFPTGSVSGCPAGAGEGCKARSTSLLVDYSGENGAVGMGIAILAGIAVGLLVYYLLARPFRSPRR